MLVLLMAVTALVMGQTADVTHVDSYTDGVTYPGRIAPSAGGGIYVTDQPMGVVVEYDAAGLLVGTYAIPEGPVGIAAHPDGRIFVSRLDGVVAYYDAAFVYQGEVDATPFAMVAPNDIAIHPVDEEIYVTDSEAHQVFVFDPTTGALARTWGTQGSGLLEFQSPQAIAIDAALGRVIVTDVDNFRVQIFDTAGAVLTKFGYRTLYVGSGQLAWVARAEGVAVDSCSNIYLADALMGTIRVFDSMGSELDPDFVPAVGFGTGAGELRIPIDVAIDSAGQMYVASTNNAAVEVYDLTCSAALAPAHGNGGKIGQLGKDQKFNRQGKRKATQDAHAAIFAPRIEMPDNPFDIVAAMDSGRYLAELDVNRDRRITSEDLEIVVEHFGGATVKDFLGEAGTRFSPEYTGEPHMIDIAYVCGRCHSFDGAPGGMLSAEGQENLCVSCHTGSARAMSTPIGGAHTNSSHPWGAAADTTDVAGPLAGSELALHLDGTDVRCGTCHEPHNQLSGEPYLRAPVGNAALCGECHAEADEWALAGHADATSTAFTYPVGEGREPCVKCHSGLGFIDFAAGLPQDEQRTDMQIISCFVCHATHGSGEQDLLRIVDEVVLPGDVEVTDGGASATCMVCHNGRRVPGEGTTPHYALAGVMLEGINGVEFGENIPSSPHKDLAQCVDCHMVAGPDAGQPGAGKVGGHTFNMSVHDPEDPDYGFENYENACNTEACHGAGGARAPELAVTGFNRLAFGDYDGDGEVEGVQDEVQGLMDMVFAEIIATGAVFLGHYPYWDFSAVVDDPPGTLQTVEDAVWNWEYVDNSGDLGVHNTGYAVGLLQVTFKALTGADVPDAFLRYGTDIQIYPNTIVGITSVNGGAPVEVGGPFTVDFTIEDDTGDPIAQGDLNRLRIYVSGPTINYQRVLDRDDDPANFTQNPDGSYTYTAPAPFPSVYLAPVNDSPFYGADDGEWTGLPLVEGTYTVLIESRRVFGSIRKAGDATFDFVVADDPLTPPALAPREFVLQESCAACHLDLQLHGGNRKTVKGCIVCHTSGAEDLITDPTTTEGVSVQLADMIHRLHRGHDLRSVSATAHGADPYRYEIIGFNESLHDFSDVGFPYIPAGITDCGACHAGAAQADEIYTSTRARCGGCHDDIDFVTGTILDQSNPSVEDGLLTEAELTDPTYRVFPGGVSHIFADETACMFCHGPGTFADAEIVHQHPTDPEQEGTQPAVEIISVAGMTGGGGTYFQAGDFFEVTFKLSDDTADPLEIVPGNTSTLDRLEVYVAGPTTLYQTIIDRQRPWSGGALAVDPAQWVDNFAVDGTYTFISEDPWPADYPAQANALGEPPEEQIFAYEGGWGQQYTAEGTPLDNGTYSIVAFGRRLTPTDGEREPLRTGTFDVPYGSDDALVPYADTAPTASCNACHSVLAFHGNQRYGMESCVVCHTAGSQDGGTFESVDLRIMIHKLHNARNLDVVAQGGAYELNGFFGIADFSHLLISAMPGEAAECQACHVNDDWKSPPTRETMRTWMVVCTSCHDAAQTATHVAAATVSGTFVETCTSCHGDGAAWSVEAVHKSP